MSDPDAILKHFTVTLDVSTQIQGALVSDAVLAMSNYRDVISCHAGKTAFLLSVVKCPDTHAHIPVRNKVSFDKDPITSYGTALRELPFVLPPYKCGQFRERLFPNLVYQSCITQGYSFSLEDVTKFRSWSDTIIVARKERDTQQRACSDPSTLNKQLHHFGKALISNFLTLLKEDCLVENAFQPGSLYTHTDHSAITSEFQRTPPSHSQRKADLGLEVRMSSLFLQAGYNPQAKLNEHWAILKKVLKNLSLRLLELYDVAHLNDTGRKDSWMTWLGLMCRKVVRVHRDLEASRRPLTNWSARDAEELQGIAFLKKFLAAS